MNRYVQGPRHAARGPYRGLLLPMTVLVALLAVVVVGVVWMVVA
ncbi:hypothetical protein [Microbacterium sp.]|nr:hypothetical protein [Microbacterium sp.]